MTRQQLTTERLERLTPGQAAEVLGLVRAATEEDGVAPLSEQVLLSIHDRARSVSAAGADAGRTAGTGGTGDTGGTRERGTGERGTGDTGIDGDTGRTARLASPGPAQVLVYAGTHLTGYAHLGPGAADRPMTAELVVAPSGRRQGVGTVLLQVLEGAAGARTLHLWSHGDLAGARVLALRRDYSRVRELWQMRRSLRADAAPLPAVIVPEGFLVRHFVVGQDEEAWIRVNARAFVDHPEQGKMTRADLERRIAEPWFDAEGFILIEDMRARPPVLAASHWTKVVPIDRRAARPAVEPSEGEVYVVGVDPAYQGVGLGRAATLLGLEHLRARGLTEAMLYVEADNPAAVMTYTHLAFARSAVDIMYSRTVHTAV